jgi:hypothetical protein
MEWYLVKPRDSFTLTLVKCMHKYMTQQTAVKHKHNVLLPCVRGGLITAMGLCA